MCFDTLSVANSISGRVASVLDGDTLEVLHNQHPERIRLSSIDCPEEGQAYGKRAMQAASELVFGREIMLQAHGHGNKHALADGSYRMVRTSITRSP
jgi:endonuclease YncB( thermonuclease family)